MREDQKPFNNVIDHFNKVEGNAVEAVNVDYKKLPTFIRWIGYFIFGGVLISIILVIILSILEI